MDKIMPWVDHDVGVLGLLNGVRLHEAQDLVPSGVEWEEAHHLQCGNVCSYSCPYISRTLLPPKVSGRIYCGHIREWTTCFFTTNGESSPNCYILPCKASIIKCSACCPTGGV